ncbi:MAG: molybdopterin dinucleotide binding domain-containing protein, partial [Nitrososphaerales archaeon]
GRSLVHGVGKEAGKFSDKYIQEVSTCQIDPEDLKTLDIKPGDCVRLTTEYGSVVLKVSSSALVHRGSVFIPYGPYANLLIGTKTGGTGMPSFKGIPVEVEPAPGESVPELKELLVKMYGRSR